MLIKGPGAKRLKTTVVEERLSSSAIFRECPGVSCSGQTFPLSSVSSILFQPFPFHIFLNTLSPSHLWSISTSCSFHLYFHGYSRWLFLLPPDNMPKSSESCFSHLLCDIRHTTSSYFFISDFVLPTLPKSTSASSFQFCSSDLPFYSQPNIRCHTVVLVLLV